jgi:hypothetical protein
MGRNGNEGWECIPAQDGAYKAPIANNLPLDLGPVSFLDALDNLLKEAPRPACLMAWAW